jgi:hypothetical protein
LAIALNAMATPGISRRAARVAVRLPTNIRSRDSIACSRPRSSFVPTYASATVLPIPSSAWRAVCGSG